MTHMEFAHPYFGAFVMFIVTFGAFGATVWLSRYISRKIARLDTEKLKTTLYECGPEVTKQPNTISTQFYLTALLFILFDVCFCNIGLHHLNGLFNMMYSNIMRILEFLFLFVSAKFYTIFLYSLKYSKIYYFLYYNFF